jgi:malate dehydrogenase (oxaloacetate-decarboxylating)(NADP+)
MDTGVAKKPIKNLEAYRRELEGRTNPIASILEPIKSRIKNKKQKVVFAEGEEEKTIRAALSFYNSGFGIPILIGRENRVRETMEEVNLEGLNELIIHNASLSKDNKKYIDNLYKLALCIINSFRPSRLTSSMVSLTLFSLPIKIGIPKPEL